MDAAEFRARYRRLIKRLWPRKVPGGGYSAADIAAAERDLQFRLPGMLRDYYRHFGRLAPINRTSDTLLAPAELRTDGKYRVFYECHQDVGSWGIPLAPDGPDDPPVYLRYRHKRAQWQLAFDQLSDFFLTIFCWEAVNGGAPCGGYAYLDPSLRRRVRRDYPPMPSRSHLKGLQAFGNRGPILCLVEDEPPMLEVAAGTEAQLQKIARRYGLEWAHAWPD
jgi:hypothetical protein